MSADPITPTSPPLVGLAMNNALELLTKGLEHDEVIERIITPEFWYSVWEVSSDQIRVARELERGRLAPSPTDRTKRAGEAKKGLPARSTPDRHPDFDEAQLPPQPEDPPPF